MWMYTNKIKKKQTAPDKLVSQNKQLESVTVGEK